MISVLEETGAPSIISTDPDVGYYAIDHFPRHELSDIFVEVQQQGDGLSCNLWSDKSVSCAG